MNDMLIMIGFGFILVALGILLLKRENRFLKDAITTKAKVVTYYDYVERTGDTPPITMYTMAVEYFTQSGELIHAREQSGSATKKYAIGADITISYSKVKTDFFIVAGDQSRKAIMIGMIVVGLLIIVGVGYLGLKSMYM